MHNESFPIDMDTAMQLLRDVSKGKDNFDSFRVPVHLLENFSCRNVVSTLLLSANLPCSLEKLKHPVRFPMFLDDAF